MDIWESYESLPPLERIITTFAVTAILVVVIFVINKKVKRHSNISPGIIGTNGNLERKPDGTLLAYIAFWRYLIFGAIFAGAFCMCIYGFVVLYQELPSGFYKHWNKQATVTFLAPVLATAMFFWGYSLLKGCYKKVQFELDNYQVRYLRSGTRGGTILSENSVSVPLKGILEVELRQNPFGGGVITARTSTEVHNIILLLSTGEQQICYRELQEAIHSIKMKGRTR
nr:hypothetical protein [uncultured Pedobacter sp.]